MSAQAGDDAEPSPRSATLREFADFLRRPRLLKPGGLRAPGAWRFLGRMVALQIAVLLAVLLPLLHVWQTAFGLPSPDAFGQLEPALMVPVVVLIAPILEELAFRGWLTGRVRALWLLACALVFGGLLFATTRGIAPLAVGMGTVALMLAAPIGWFLLRRRGTPGWFARGFPAIFYLTVALFALAHAMNYPRFSLLALPMVLPQLWGALVLGFVRMRIGLPASILAHAAANSAALGIALLASLAAGS